MFEIKTDEKSLLKSGTKKVKVSFFEKLRLIYNCYPNKR